MRHRTARWLLVVLLAAAPAWAVAETSVNPGINAAYQGADPNRWRGVFERDGREVWDRRHDILTALNLRPGMAVADVGAGTGFFAMMFAEAVGQRGLVYAVDITPEFVEDIRMQASGLGRRNVRGIVNTARSAMLPANSVDLVFTSDTYHHFEYPHSMLESIHAALRPGGELVVVDFKRIPGFSHPWVLGHVRAGEETVRAEIEAAGFELIERNDFMQTQYFLRFRKR
jgi:predicted methyltransferase